jgi:hypothetical protein
MKTILSAVVIGVFACNAAAAQTLLGQWQIAAAGVAPWIAPDKIHTIKESDVRRYVKQRVTFAVDEVKSRDPLLACKGARYEPTRIPPAGLFQGNLPEPKGQTARTLGLADGITPGMDVACPNGRFSYHFRDKDTALFALDNVIYTLKRR